MQGVKSEANSGEGGTERSAWSKLGDVMRQWDIANQFAQSPNAARAARFAIIRDQLQAEMDLLTDAALTEMGQAPCACGRDWAPKGTPCNFCKKEAAALPDPCPLCGENRNHPSQAIRGGHSCHR